MNRDELEPARGRYEAAMGKRPGEDRFFSGAFVVFCHISAIFCAFCLVIKRIFVYLRTEKEVASRKMICKFPINILIFPIN